MSTGMAQLSLPVGFSALAPTHLRLFFTGVSASPVPELQLFVPIVQLVAIRIYNINLSMRVQKQL